MDLKDQEEEGEVVLVEVEDLGVIVAEVKVTTMIIEGKTIVTVNLLIFQVET